MDHNENLKLEMLVYYLKAMPQHHLNSNVTGFTPSRTTLKLENLGHSLCHTLIKLIGCIYKVMRKRFKTPRVLNSDRIFLYFSNSYSPS